MSMQTQLKIDYSIGIKTKTVLVVDDNPLSSKRIIDSFDKVSEFSVTASAKDGNEALSIIRKQHFDIIILDLFMPNCDALGFLKQVHMQKMLMNTKIIVLSEVQDESIVEQALNWGAKYVLFKPYTSQTLIERVSILTSVKEKKLFNQLDIHSQVIHYLVKSGLPSHTCGYQYFRFAIEHVLNESMHVFSITKSIYPHVAEEFQTSSGNVDKAMRHSLSLAFEKNKSCFTQFLKSMNYKNSMSKPSNSEYIGMILEKIKEDNYQSQS